MGETARHAERAQVGSGNLLLASLPASELALLLPRLEQVELESSRTLYDPDQVITHVYFPRSGLVSLLGVFTDGSGVETAIIGREGMVGMPVFHATDRMSEQAVVQIPASADCMTADALRSCLQQAPSLRRVLHHYAASVFMFAAQSVACMSKHQTTGRLARWLLHAADHSGSDRLALTHLFMSHMLGVRRASVSIAANELRAAKLITYKRRLIELVDRAGLEQRACECYGIIRSTYDRLIFGIASRSPIADIQSSRGGKSIVGAPHNGDPDDDGA